LLLLVPPGVTLSPELEDDITILDFDPPSYAELGRAFTEAISSTPKSSRPVLNEAQMDQLLAAGMGLTAHEGEAAMSRALVENRTKLPGIPVEDLANVIMKVKTEAVKKTDVLEVMDAESMNDVGGLANLKEWVEKRSPSFSQEARDFGIEAPKGLLLVGPPGTGMARKQVVNP
jgi:SpoVK/Ycf46/Vps4 family AAA+-type ATPase